MLNLHGVSSQTSLTCPWLSYSRILQLNLHTVRTFTAFKKGAFHLGIYLRRSDDDSLKSNQFPYFGWGEIFNKYSVGVMKIFEYNHESLFLLFLDESSVLVGFLIDALSLVEVLEYLVEACDDFSRVVDQLHVELLISLVDIPCIDLEQSVWGVIHVIELVFIDSLK